MVAKRGRRKTRKGRVDDDISGLLIPLFSALTSRVHRTRPALEHQLRLEYGYFRTILHFKLSVLNCEILTISRASVFSNDSELYCLPHILFDDGRNRVYAYGGSIIAHLNTCSY
jgi:hypothetical protein